MKKCIVLNNLELTPKKQSILNNFFKEYRRVLNLTWLQLPIACCSTELHHFTYSNIRKTSFLPSDIIEEARKDIWSTKTVSKSFSIRLNKRWFRFVKSKRGNPIFKITYSPRKSFNIPVKLDNQWQRLDSFISDDWSFKHISLLKDGRIAVLLEKEFSKQEINQRYALGIDIGSSTLAAVSIFDIKTSKVVRQLYFGRDIAMRQRRFEIRRAKLKSLADKGSSRAKKSLINFRHKQFNFVKTRSGQIAKEIVNLAKSYNAYISIEKLKNLRAIKGKINKAGRKKINRIPYNKFIDFLKSNSKMFQIPLYEVDAYHTSKWCSNCGAINNGHQSKNYALYRCNKCGLIVNSDRKASLAVAIKSVLERSTHSLTLSSVQISKTRVSVNALLRSNDVVLVDAVHFKSSN